MKSFRKGAEVRTIKKLDLAEDVKVGTKGKIIGVRKGTNLRLVKYEGRSWPVQTSTYEIEEVV